MIKKIFIGIFLVVIISIAYYYFPFEEEIIIEEEILIEEEKEEVIVEKIMIFAEIKGAIKKPGVYEMEEGKRIFNLIELAGGITKDADLSNINQAKKLSDEMSIKIWTKKELEDLIVEPIIEPTLISINTATITDLITLPNIGEKTAENIIDYRTSNNGFNSLEDIMEVSGIGESTFAKIKDYITL